MDFKALAEEMLSGKDLPGIWEEWGFNPITIEQTQDQLRITTSFGILQISCDDFFSQLTFCKKFFSQFGKVLSPVTAKVWRTWLTGWGKMIKRVNLQDIAESQMESCLDQIISLAEEVV